MKSVSGLGAIGAGLGLERKGNGTGVGGGLGRKHCMLQPRSERATPRRGALDAFSSVSKSSQVKSKQRRTTLGH